MLRSIARLADRIDDFGAQIRNDFRFRCLLLRPERQSIQENA
jgi:hypothetical protein